MGRKRPAVRPEKPRKGLVLKEEDYGQMILPLKNGAGEMQLAKARLIQRILSELVDKEPDLFREVQARAEGRGGEITREQRQKLLDLQVLTRAGGVQADFKAVMAAALHQTPVRPVILEPFDLTNPDHAAIVQRHDEWFQEMLDKSEPRVRMFVAELVGQARKNDKGEGRL